MAIQKRGVYGLKTYGPTLYTWTPDRTLKRAKPNEPCRHGTIKEYCTATDGSQGEDWITTYVYEDVFVDGTLERLAYVSCEYVQ